jgi:hypothetical protein
MADGKIVYQGAAKESTKYFSRIGFECPRYANPADFFMKLLTINYPLTKTDEEKLEILNGGYLKRLLLPILDNVGKEQKADYKIGFESNSKNAGFCLQTSILTKRCAIN